MEQPMEIPSQQPAGLNRRSLLLGGLGLAGLLGGSLADQVRRNEQFRRHWRESLPKGMRRCRRSPQRQ
jgi:hypothetical protein